MYKKFQDFLKITLLLNKKGIIPALYGSLGLYQIIEPLGKIDDIDLLIPEIWLTNKWDEFKNYLESHQFIIDNEHEHEFSHNKIDGFVAFGSIEESKTHSGLDIDNLELIENNGLKYFVLNEYQYLAAYRACLEDSYRQHRKGNSDLQKIKALEEYIKIKKLINY